MTSPIYNWQQKGWPKFTFDHAALEEELAAFKVAFARVQKALEKPRSPNVVMNALVDEAMKTSAIEGIRLDESVVMSSICKALGMKDVPSGFTKDVRAEGVAQMVLAVKDDWNKPISARLIRSWHAALLANDPRDLTVGDFRSHAEPMRVVRRNAYGEIEIRFEAPPSARVPDEIAVFVAAWRKIAHSPEKVALKAAFLHPHFESIHPFEDGNGRVGRALVAKAISEGLGQSLVLPVSTVIDRHRKDYYEAINGASQSLDWTSWAKFFIPVLTETLNDFVSATLRDDERYQLNLEPDEPLNEPINEPLFDGINDGIKLEILRAVEQHPGVRTPLLAENTGKSVPTVERAIAALVKAGRIEHRGSKKTGGYFPLNKESHPQGKKKGWK